MADTDRELPAGIQYASALKQVGVCAVWSIDLLNDVDCLIFTFQGWEKTSHSNGLFLRAVRQ